jgi:shikimate dehydrogenase
VADRRGPTGATRVAAVIGRPVHHSLSPTLHNAAFAAAGLDWVYVAFDVGAGGGAAAIAGARSMGVAGLSVTMPCKEEVAVAVDRLSPVAAKLKAVNTVVADGVVMVGHNTDGEGFLDALRTDQGWDPTGRSCLVVGAGGAARAVVLGLAEAGAARVVVVNRRPIRAQAAAGLAGTVGRVGTLADVHDADLVVNATPEGMGGQSGPLTDELVARLRGSSQLLVDLVYDPPTTRLLARAASAGVVTANGLGMLVHQAARAFSLWTTHPAPLAAMLAAAQDELARRDRAQG